MDEYSTKILLNKKGKVNAPNKSDLTREAPSALAEISIANLRNIAQPLLLYFRLKALILYSPRIWQNQGVIISYLHRSRRETVRLWWSYVLRERFFQTNYIQHRNEPIRTILQQSTDEELPFPRILYKLTSIKTSEAEDCLLSISNTPSILFDGRCVRVACVLKGRSGSGLKSIAFLHSDNSPSINMPIKTKSPDLDLRKRQILN